MEDIFKLGYVLSNLTFRGGNELSKSKNPREKQTRIIVPYLEIGGEKVKTPIGLSELLEPVWSSNVNTEEVEKTVSQYDCEIYKNERGRWVTHFKKGKNI